MAIKKTHREFTELLFDKNKNFKNNDFILIGKYINMRTRILIKNKYGKCSVMPDLLLKGSNGCITTAIDKVKYLKNEFKEIYNDFYNYDLVEYISANSKIKIGCKYHGIFKITPNEHKQGRGCNKCSFEKSGDRCRMSEKELVERFNIVHNNEYTYPDMGYTNNRGAIKAVCKKHGQFEKLAQSHLNGSKCPSCKKDDIIENMYNSFRKKHKNRFDYSKSIYNGSKAKMLIICREHGHFYTTPSHHIKGDGGCKKCCKIKISRNAKKCSVGWSYSSWQKKGEESKNFDSFKVYIIKCWNDDEEFYKVGKTFRTLEDRFGKLNYKSIFPYSYKVIKIIEDKINGRRISDLEEKISKENRDFKYKPLISFCGETECFSKIKNLSLLK